MSVTVWLVMAFDWGDTAFIGVFSTEEKAIEAAHKAKATGRFEGYDLRTTTAILDAEAQDN